MEKKSMTTSEAGRKGGIACRNGRGPEYYERIGKMGGSYVKLLLRLGREEVERRIAREGACKDCALPPSLHKKNVRGKSVCPVVV